MTIRYINSPVFIQDWPLVSIFPVRRDRLSTVQLNVIFEYEPKNEEDVGKVNALLEAHRNMLDGALGRHGNPMITKQIPSIVPILRDRIPNNVVEGSVDYQEKSERKKSLSEEESLKHKILWTTIGAVLSFAVILAVLLGSGVVR